MDRDVHERLKKTKRKYRDQIMGWGLLRLDIEQCGVNPNPGVDFNGELESEAIAWSGNLKL